VSSDLPVFRHSDFETFAACPWAYGCNLVRMALAPGADAMTLHPWVCEAGAEYLVRHCVQEPIFSPNFLTTRGITFHAFARDYGAYCKRKGIRSDWAEAERLAMGRAVTEDNRLDNRLRQIMVGWAQVWEYDPPGDEQAQIALVEGSFETGQAVAMQAPSGPFIYSWHPDYARLSRDGKRLSLYDWKAGVSAARFSPKRPPLQHQRYAIGFCDFFPGIKTVQAEVWFVNPDNPLSEESPLTWEFGAGTDELDKNLVVGPVEAIRNCQEFAANPGCWLCGFCQWAHTCEMMSPVGAAVGSQPRDPEGLWILRQETYRLSSALTARRQLLTTELKRVVVGAGGPVVVGTDPKTGAPIEYGPIAETQARVANMSRFLAECAERGRDPGPLLAPKDAGALAAWAQVGDPFAADDRPGFDCIRVERVVLYGIIEQGNLALEE